MAFHSRSGSISRSARTNQRDKESILGLSGWLFADLLLAIAVIFLVVQDKTKAADAGTGATTTTSTSLPPAKKTGLIADRSRQLRVIIPGGASLGSTSQGFRDKLARASFRFDDGGQTEISVDSLKEKNLKVGMVIWFARNPELRDKTFNKYFGTLVRWLLDEGLILESQFDQKRPENFPNLPYLDDDAGDSVTLRIFLFSPQ